MSETDFNVGAWAMVCWIYNTSGIAFAKIAYGEDQHPSYLIEKADVWGKSPVRALGFLDEHCRARVLEAIRRHEHDARMTVG